MDFLSGQSFGHSMSYHSSTGESVDDCMEEYNLFPNVVLLTYGAMQGYYMKVVTSRGRSFFLNHPMFAEQDFLTPMNRKKGEREKREEVILLKKDTIFDKDDVEGIHTINEGKDVYVIGSLQKMMIGSDMYLVKKYHTGVTDSQYLTGDLFKKFYYYVRIIKTQKDDIDDYLKRISDGLASGNQVVIETESGVEPKLKLTVTKVDTIKRSITISKRSCTMFHPYSGMSILFIVGKYPIIKESKKGMIYGRSDIKSLGGEKRRTRRGSKKSAKKTRSRRRR
jgi:hypothetical protein